MKIGIDVGGTFTDFLVTQPGAEPLVHKVLSTPEDPSIALVAGLEEIAARQGTSIRAFGRSIETIVHGTTVATNAVLTHTGAKTGLLTTRGVRDALEMRRGVREEQYNNRYTNVQPIVPRHLRQPVAERLDWCGKELEPLRVEDVREAIEQFKAEEVEAVAICFMNSFANPAHERQAEEVVRQELPGAYLTTSSEFLPAIRFYDRVSSTVLNSYVGPKLSAYLVQLTSRLRQIDFRGVLLVMQSNGGVVSPEIAQRCAAVTLLSGPAAGPAAGLGYVRAQGSESCITVDMGGTSFDAALVRDGAATVMTEGEINRHRIALPMLDIVTIGAGGGSIGWIDEGGLLRMGPQSAGADPGPVCYGRGGTLPTCTDADLVLGYLDADFFAGGRIRLDRDAAAAAIERHVAQPLGLSVEDAAAGMYRVINANMAQGVREISIKRGVDPREFPLVAAGGAGPLHAAMICQELELAMFIVPRESSIFCAAGMLLSDLQHDAVRSFVAPLESLDWRRLDETVSSLLEDGQRLLAQEGISESERRYVIKLDCRYAKQYHEVSFPIDVDAVRGHDAARMAAAFHREHRRLYGYALEEDGTSIEIINVRLQATGVTEKPRFPEEPNAGADPSSARKGEREIYLPENRVFQSVPVFDGDRTRHGHHIAGPAIIEQVNTTLLLLPGNDCVCDRHGSFVVRQKGREAPRTPGLQEATV